MVEGFQRDAPVITGGDYLEVASQGEQLRRIFLRKARVHIGRSNACDIQLAGGYVSRRHARLERDLAGHWRLIDVGSANGTFVNGRRIQVAALRDADVIAVGTHRLTLHCPSAQQTDTGTGTATDTNLEIVPSVATSRVVDRATLSPNRVVPARLLGDLHEAGRRLGRSADIPSLLAAVAQEFRSLLQPRRIAVGREDGAQCQWPVVTDERGRPADSSDLPRRLVPRVQALEGSIAIKLDSFTPVGVSKTGKESSGSLLFPVKAGNRRLGHVYVELSAGGPPVTDEAIEFLSLLTRQAALIWENLELHAVRRDADELHRELSAAREIQLQLFPAQRVLDPRLEIAAENVPALTVSGDYYDFQLIEPGRILFILADVMGHGLPAALMMTSVQAVFRTGVRAGWDLVQLDQRIHDVVEASGQGESFVTGLLGLCDLATDSLTLLSAGHPWPSIWRSGSRLERNEQACSLPWGIFTERSVAPSVAPLAPGDWSIVAYTDGVAETLGPNGSPYGAARLKDLHHQHRERHAEEICEEILTDVLRSSDDSTPQHDDITLLVLRSSGCA